MLQRSMRASVGPKAFSPALQIDSNEEDPGGTAQASPCTLQLQFLTLSRFQDSSFELKAAPHGPSAHTGHSLARRLTLNDSWQHASSGCSFWEDELSRDSAIDHQLLPTDEGRLLIVAEKADSLGYICWLPRPACVHNPSNVSHLATESRASRRHWPLNTVSLDAHSLLAQQE